MKKLLLSSLALAACLGVSAAAPDALYLLGNIKDNDWDPENPVEATSSEDGVFVYENVTLVGTPAYFTFINEKTNDWDVVNDGEHRYGPAEGTEAALTLPVDTKFEMGGDVSWNIAGGTYTLTVDFNDMKLYIVEGSESSDGGNGDGQEPGPVDTWSAYFDNTDDWAEVYVWAWDDDNNYTGGEWPGIPATYEESTGLWFVEGEGTPKYIIFNNNNNGEQTGDLKFVNGATYNAAGEIAGVNSLKAADGVEVIYNLQGVRVNRNNMKAGIYIINGKKVAVK